MTKKKNAKAMQKLIKPTEIKVKSPLSEKKNAWLHPIHWLDQLMLDAQVEEIIIKAGSQNFSDTARTALSMRVVAVTTIQASLYTKKDPNDKGEKVFPTLQAAFDFYKGAKITECFALYELYAAEFEITDAEKKS